MKRILLLIIAVMTLSLVHAQAQDYDLEFGCNVGMTTMNNFSAVSLFYDEADSYSTWSESLYLGIRKNAVLNAIKFKYAIYNTSAVALNETVAHSEIGWVIRRYINADEHFEPFMGLGLGVSAWLNGFNYLGKDYSRNRWGLYGEFEMGLNYNINDQSYIGICTAINVVGVNFDKEMNLPSGLTATEKPNFGGYNLMMQFGFRF